MAFNFSRLADYSGGFARPVYFFAACLLAASQLGAGANFQRQQVTLDGNKTLRYTTDYYGTKQRAESADQTRQKKY